MSASSPIFLFFVLLKFILMKKVLVTEAERRKIAAEATIMMGSKVTQKVIDINTVVKWIREERKNKNLSPYVEIQPISEDQLKNRSKTATFQKDPLTGVLYGIAISSDDFGNIRWQKIQVGDMLSLNLDNDNDAKIWSVLRFDPDIQGSPFQKENPYFKVYDPVDDALAEQAEIAAMQKAFERVAMLIKDPKRMVQFARYMGEELMDNTNYDIVYGALLKKARHQSALFNQRWESRARSYAEHFYSALALGIITESADGGFMFGNLPLGLSKADAIKFLSKDRVVMDSLSDELDRRDNAVQGVASTIVSSQEQKKVNKTEDNELE
jgi:hypothetical protein